MLAPLSHAPGEVQADFGEALVVIARAEYTAHYLGVDLPHSDDCFVAVRGGSISLPAPMPPTKIRNFELQ